MISSFISIVLWDKWIKIGFLKRLKEKLQKQWYPIVHRQLLKWTGDDHQTYKLLGSSNNSLTMLKAETRLLDFYSCAPTINPYHLNDRLNLKGMCTEYYRVLCRNTWGSPFSRPSLGWNTVSVPLAFRLAWGSLHGTAQCILPYRFTLRSIPSWWNRQQVYHSLHVM